MWKNEMMSSKLAQAVSCYVYHKSQKDCSACIATFHTCLTVGPIRLFTSFSVTSKKSPNVYKSCPKMISQEKLKILTPLQKFPKNVGDLGKLIVAQGFEKMPNKSNKLPNLVTLISFHKKLHVMFHSD